LEASDPGFGNELAIDGFDVGVRVQLLKRVTRVSAQARFMVGSYTTKLCVPKRGVAYSIAGSAAIDPPQFSSVDRTLGLT